MSDTVNQPSLNPTNKLTAATLAAAMMEVSRVIVMNYAPEWYSPELWSALTPIMVFAMGWLIKDKPNVVTE